MVTRADRHSGQRGIRTSLTSLVVSLVRLVASRMGGGRSVGVGVEPCLARRYLDGADTLVAGAVGTRAGMVAAPLESSGGVAGPATPPARLNWALCPHCLPQGSLLDRGVPGCAWGWPPPSWAPRSGAPRCRTRPRSARPGPGRAG